MIKKAVIDFSSFVGPNNVCLIKELTIADVDSKSLLHWIFRPPKDVWANHAVQIDANDTYLDMPYERQNSWLSKHFHGLHFSTGYVDYDCLKRILDHVCFDIKLLFAPTTDKARVLEDLMDSRRAVVSLELMGCSPAPSSYKGAEDEKECLLHHIYSPNFNCTQRNVHYYLKWCAANADAIDMEKPANRLKTFADWKLSKPSSKDISDQGFVHMCSGEDSVKCVYCGVILFRFEYGDDIATDHAYNSPFCGFIKRKEQEESAKDAENQTKNELLSCCRI